MNNFPAMTEAQIKWMIAHCVRVMSESSPGDFEYLTAQIALAALTAEPEYYFRKRSDGGRERPIHRTETEDSRKGSWSPLYPSPPAPVLKPIVLPGKGGVEATSEKSIRDWSDGWAAYREEAIKAIRAAGYEVKQ